MGRTRRRIRAISALRSTVSDRLLTWLLALTCAGATGALGGEPRAELARLVARAQAIEAEGEYVRRASSSNLFERYPDYDLGLQDVAYGIVQFVCRHDLHRDLLHFLTESRDFPFIAAVSKAYFSVRPDDSAYAAKVVAVLASGFRSASRDTKWNYLYVLEQLLLSFHYTEDLAVCVSQHIRESLSSDLLSQGYDDRTHFQMSFLFRAFLQFRARENEKADHEVDVEDDD